MARYALEMYDRLSSRRRRSATNPSWLVGNNVAGQSFPGIGPLIPASSRRSERLQRRRATIATQRASTAGENG